MMQDSWNNTHHDRSDKPGDRELNEEDAETCPPGMIEYEDCRTFPCKVTCKEPSDTKR
jgi:hypothetical protein